MRLLIPLIRPLSLILRLLRSCNLCVLLPREIFIQIVRVFEVGVFRIESPPLVLLLQLFRLKVVAPMPVDGVEELSGVELEQARDRPPVLLDQGLDEAQLVMDRRANLVMLRQA